MKRRALGLTLRFSVLERSRFRCHYCGVGAREAVLEVDHVLPVSAGGTNDINNLVAACFDCNRGKRARRLAGSFSSWLRMQRGREDYVGDLADDESRLPLGDIRTYWELRAALVYANACRGARVAGYHAWREYQRGRPTAVVLEQQAEHAAEVANRQPGTWLWTKAATQ